MASILLKILLVFVFVQKIEANSTTTHRTALQSTITTSTISMTITLASKSLSASNYTIPNKATSQIKPTTTLVTSTSEGAKKLSKSSKISRPTSTLSDQASSATPTGSKPDDEAEPKLSLYLWQIVACGAGGFVLLLFIVISLLWIVNEGEAQVDNRTKKTKFQIRKLRKRLRALRSYSIPIKENGVWIDHQDIPLWQKRASTYNVQENPAAHESETT